MVAEYHRLFGSLFANADIPIKVIELLATKRQGFTRKEILAKTKIQDSGSFSETLNALQSSDLIAKYLPFGESKRNEMYKLSDNFCCFTLRFLDKMQKGDSQYWQKNYTSQKLNTWRGLAFEELCFAHISQIKKALGISGVSSTQSDWILQGSAETKGTQIDLLISRDDNVVNVCEIKYYSKPYTIDKNYDVILRDRLQTLIEHLPQKKTVHMTFISTFGLQQNEYSGQIQSQVVLDDLFEKE